MQISRPPQSFKTPSPISSVALGLLGVILASPAAFAQDIDIITAYDISDEIDINSYTQDLDDEADNDRRRLADSLEEEIARVEADLEGTYAIMASSQAEISGENDGELSIEAFRRRIAEQEGLLLRSQTKAQVNERKLAQLNSELADLKKASKGFWTSKSFSLTGNLGLAINPNKKGEQNGEQDQYFNPIIFTNFSKKLDESDSNANTSTTLSLSGLLYAKDHFENLGSDVEVSAIYGGYTRVFDKCWVASLSPGAELITSNFYSNRLSWDFPVKAQVTRNFYKDGKCSGSEVKPHSNAALRYTRTLSNPSTGNRHEIRLFYSHNFKLGTATTLKIAPMVKYTSFSNLADDAELDNTDYHLALSISRQLSDKASLTFKGELGRRESSDPLRDSDFADLPLSVSLKRSF